MTLSELEAFIPSIYTWLPEDMQSLAHDVLRELTTVLKPLLDLGLSYLQLSRAGATLSTGELQRIQLARTLRTQTTGVLYVLDEPSIGLHPANVAGLIDVMRSLVAQGNSVVVVDHDTAIIDAADEVLEIGPGAGEAGGHLLNQGTPAAVAKQPNSLIGPYLTGKANMIVRPTAQAKATTAKKWYGLTVTDRFNLHNLTVQFPVNQLSVVSGFSGAGKSTWCSTLGPGPDRDQGRSGAELRQGLAARRVAAGRRHRCQPGGQKCALHRRHLHQYPRPAARAVRRPA